MLRVAAQPTAHVRTQRQHPQAASPGVGDRGVDQRSGDAVALQCRVHLGVDDLHHVARQAVVADVQATVHPDQETAALGVVFDRWKYGHRASVRAGLRWHDPWLCRSAPSLPMKTVVLVAAASLLLAPAVFAADPPGRAGPRVSGFGAKAGGPLLTRNELRACLQRQERIRVETQSVGRDRGAIEAAQAELLRSGDEIKAELAALDRTNVEAVEKYVARAQARDKRIDEHTAAADAFNARVGALQAEREAFSAACDNRRYDEADENAIRAGR